ncbi:MAG TPA: hypothetical protein VFU20_01285 [Sphingomicrobium sp.]|nr:hypothetical protein [Sphingomicrobium sp.]
MLRSLLPAFAVLALVAASGACSPAEPPLLIDGGQAPASDVGSEAPSSEPPAAGSDKQAVSG